MKYKTIDNICNVDCNTNSVTCQDVLESELVKRFRPKKILCNYLADSFKRLGDKKKAFRVKHCGDLLDWKVFQSDSENGGFPTGTPGGSLSETVHSDLRPTLYGANFCRERLCPMCAFRRSLKIFGQVSQIMNRIESEYDFIFLTLTVRNCLSGELEKTITQMQNAWRCKFRNKADFKRVVKGYFKVLEVTHNLNVKSKSYNTYHPHFHCILAVNKSYFTSRDYIKRNEWLKMWQKAYNDFLITQVDIRRVKAKTEIKQGENFVKSLSSAVAEVAKYSVKASDYIGKIDKNGSIKKYSDKVIDDTVSTLNFALKNRRLAEFGGIFKDVHIQLHLDDCEDGDLINVNGEDLRPDVSYMIYRYRWNAGVSNYELYAKSYGDSSIMFDSETGEIL